MSFPEELEGISSGHLKDGICRGSGGSLHEECGRIRCCCIERASAAFGDFNPYFGAMDTARRNAPEGARAAGLVNSIHYDDFINLVAVRIEKAIPDIDQIAVEKERRVGLITDGQVELDLSWNGYRLSDRSDAQADRAPCRRPVFSR